MPIYLIGYMACGKSTLGRALASIGIVDFVDLDELIEQQSGLTPSQWFSQRGEAAFRAAEQQALRIAALGEGSKPLVVATGGGTPCNAGAMEFMLSGGTVVWLEASVERTVKRLLEAEGSRPLVAGMDEAALLKFVPEHFGSRKTFYEKAHIHFDSSRLDTAEEIAATVEAFRAGVLRNQI